MRSTVLTIVLLVVAAGATALQPGCSAPESSPRAQHRPNVLLVTLDTTRADHTSAYGYDRPTTPRLAELAARGVRFDVAYAPMPTTLPSHASMLTGLRPLTHGTLKNGTRVDPSLPRLAEALAQDGYRTAAFVSAFPLLHRFGLARGFAAYDDDFGASGCLHGLATTRPSADDSCRRADQTIDEVVRWLEGNGYLSPARGAGAEPPFFVWVHLFDAHKPYDPPAAHARLFPPQGEPPDDLDRDRAQYDAEIHFADAEMGRLLDRLAAADRLRDTVVMVVGDHGEGLMDHGEMSHGLQLYDEAVRVPFVVAWPARIPANTIVTAPVDVTDVAPTILELTGSSLPGGDRQLDGVSLVAVMTGAAEPDLARPIVLQRRHFARGVRGSMFGVRSGDWKYLEASEPDAFELYHLPSDPQERVNLAERRLVERQRLHEQLASLRASSAARSPKHGVPKVSEQDARKLEALGYVD